MLKEASGILFSYPWMVDVIPLHGVKSWNINPHKNELLIVLRYWNLIGINSILQLDLFFYSTPQSILMGLFSIKKIDEDTQLFRSTSERMMLIKFPNLRTIKYGVGLIN